MRFLVLSPLLSMYFLLAACQGSGLGGGTGLQGNDGGSSPVNPSEERSYKQAILKCYKTGGTRVVKIEGQLKCY